MQMLKAKKGVIGQLGDIVISLVVVGIMLVVAFLIFSKVKANSDVAADVNATNAINLTTNATAQIPTWLSIIVIVAIGGLLIYLVARFRGGGQ